MSNNIFFFERIYTVSVRGVENWIATVEMSFRITTYSGNVVASGITSREMNGERPRGRGSRASLMISYDITMRPPCARTNLFCVWCIAQYRNGNTNPFIFLWATGKFSKMLEHFQKWPLSKASFAAHDCKNPSISAPREAIRHCDLGSFKIASMVVRISHLLWNCFNRTVDRKCMNNISTRN